jgi:hypothetical protein
LILIAPPWSFKHRFDANTIVLEQPYGVLVLNPVALLERKCQSILGKPFETKKQSNAQDILFLLDYPYRLGIRTSPAELRIDESLKSWFGLLIGEDSVGRRERIGR